MRQRALTHKKLRGVPRRLRALATWVQGFSGNFPECITEADRYCNYKIPVHQAMVEGKQSSLEIRKQCALGIIEACSNLMQSKPGSATATRVVATVCLPNMFASEVCIYSDEQYFSGKTTASANQFGFTKPISGRSLAEEWGLVLPRGMQELGMLEDYRGYPDSDDWYVSEHWFYGEIV